MAVKSTWAVMRAAGALRMVVLAARKTVVQQQRRAALQPAAHGGDPGFALQVDLGHIARQGRHAGGDGGRQRGRRGTVFPDEALRGIHRHAAFQDLACLAPAEDRHRHRVQHFVGQHAAGKALG
jgi:hypothetical protein